jgi:hypothetical protein
MYSETVSDILVFRTNLETPECVKRIGELLGTHGAVISWNVDVQDIDHVLRVECGDSMSAGVIIDLLHNAGFECEELPD